MQRSKQFDEYLHHWGQEASKRAWNFVSSFGRQINLVQGEPGRVHPAQ